MFDIYLCNWSPVCLARRRRPLPSVQRGRAVHLDGALTILWHTLSNAVGLTQWAGPADLPAHIQSAAAAQSAQVDEHGDPIPVEAKVGGVWVSLGLYVSAYVGSTTLSSCHNIVCLQDTWLFPNEDFW